MTSQSQQYMEQLWTLGRRCYDDMEPPEKLKLTGLIMREAPASRRAEFIIETTRFDGIALILASLMINEENLTKKHEIIAGQDEKIDLSIRLMSAAGGYAYRAIDRLFETYKQGVQSNEQEPSD